MNTQLRSAPVWAPFDERYTHILRSHLDLPRETWRLEAERLGRRMVASGLGPEDLIGMHAAVVDQCLPALGGRDARKEKLALEILIEAMMAFALAYYQRALASGKETERLAAHARTLEGLNRDLADVHRELAEKHEDLTRSHEELGRLAQQKSDLLATVTHEIRTPLTSVLGYGEFLEDGTYGDLNPEQADILHRMMQGGRDVLLLINRILDLSRLEAGRLRLDRQVMSLREVAEHAIEAIHAQALRKHLDVAIAGIPADLPPVFADSLRVLEILVNLLGNAVKFTPEGGRIEIGAALRGDEVEVWVSDTGPGIDAEQQKEIFERYAQARHGARRYGSSGLGLALCKELVALHGGRIWVESEPSRGATFRFTLPRYREPER